MESKSRLKNLDEFVENSYTTLPLDEIIKKYQREEIHPTFIFSRFQNLEIHFYKLQRRRRIEEARYKNISSKLQEQGGQHSNILGEMSNYLSKLKKLKGRDERQKIREKLRGLRKSEDSLVHKMGELSLEIEDIDEQRERALNEVRSFEKNYDEEIKYVYSKDNETSTPLVDEAFAWSRLIKPGKFRIAEPLLIAQSGVIPIDKLFNCEYIDAIDREMLIKTGNVPSDVIKKRFEDLPKRIENLEQLIKDAREFEKIGYKYDGKKLDSRLQDLEYEEIFLSDNKL